MGRALLLAPLALLAAGCGYGTKAPGPSGGASVAPRSAALLVRARTELASGQWQAVERLARLFPGAAAELPVVDQLKGAVGPESDALALSETDLEGGRILGLTQPSDPARLDTLLAKHHPPLVSEEVAGWRVVAADRRTIDALKRARNEGSLAASDAYREATSGLPADALATFYVDGTALTAEAARRAKAAVGPIPGVGRVSWLAGAISVKPGGIATDLRLKGDEIQPTQYTAELPAEVPAPVTLFVDAKGLDATLEELRRSPALPARAGSVVKALGGLLDPVIALFHGEAAFYVRSLAAGPEYSLVVKVADSGAAKETLDRLATLAGAFAQKLPQHLTVAGLPTTEIVLGKMTLYYAVFGDKVVVTSAPSGIRGLAGNAPRLTSSAPWQAAASAAGLPDETAGIAYADVARAIPLLERLADRKQEPGETPNALRTGLLYASVTGPVLSVKGFVSVR